MRVDLAAFLAIFTAIVGSLLLSPGVVYMDTLWDLREWVLAVAVGWWLLIRWCLRRAMEIRLAQPGKRLSTAEWVEDAD